MWKNLPTFLRSLSHDKFLNNFCMLSTCCRRHHTWKVRMRSGFKLKSLITSRDKHARLFIREKDAGVCTEARQWRQGAKLSYELPNRSSSSTWRVLLPSHKSCKETSVQKKRPTKKFSFLFDVCAVRDYMQNTLCVYVDLKFKECGSNHNLHVKCILVWHGGWRGEKLKMINHQRWMPHSPTIVLVEALWIVVCEKSFFCRLSSQRIDCKKPEVFLGRVDKWKLSTFFSNFLNFIFTL